MVSYVYCLSESVTQLYEKYQYRVEGKSAPWAMNGTEFDDDWATLQAVAALLDHPGGSRVLNIVDLRAALRKLNLGPLKPEMFELLCRVSHMSGDSWTQRLEALRNSHKPIPSRNTSEEDAETVVFVVHRRCARLLRSWLSICKRIQGLEKGCKYIMFSNIVRKCLLVWEAQTYNHAALERAVDKLRSTEICHGFFEELSRTLRQQSKKQNFAKKILKRRFISRWLTSLNLQRHLQCESDKFLIKSTISLFHEQLLSTERYENPSHIRLRWIIRKWRSFMLLREVEVGTSRYFLAAWRQNMISTHLKLRIAGRNTFVLLDRWRNLAICEKTRILELEDASEIYVKLAFIRRWQRKTFELRERREAANEFVKETFLIRMQSEYNNVKVSDSFAIDMFCTSILRIFLLEWLSETSSVIATRLEAVFIQCSSALNKNTQQQFLKWWLEATVSARSMENKAIKIVESRHLVAWEANMTALKFGSREFLSNITIHFFLRDWLRTYHTIDANTRKAIELLKTFEIEQKYRSVRDWWDAWLTIRLGEQRANSMRIRDDRAQLRLRIGQWRALAMPDRYDPPSRVRASPLKSSFMVARSQPQTPVPERARRA